MYPNTLLRQLPNMYQSVGPSGFREYYYTSGNTKSTFEMIWPVRQTLAPPENTHGRASFLLSKITKKTYKCTCERERAPE